MTVHCEEAEEKNVHTTHTFDLDQSDGQDTGGICKV